MFANELYKIPKRPFLGPPIDLTLIKNLSSLFFLLGTQIINSQILKTVKNLENESSEHEIKIYKQDKKGFFVGRLIFSFI